VGQLESALGQSRRFEHNGSCPLDPEERTRHGAAPRPLFPKSRALPLGFYPQELPRHRIDLGKICRDLLIAAAVTGDWMEAAVRKGLGRTWAAEMDYRGKLPLLLRAGRRL
jgi:hypothetical protein